MSLAVPKKLGRSNPEVPTSKDATGPYSLLPATAVGASDGLEASLLEELVSELVGVQHPHLVRVLGVTSDAHSGSGQIVADWSGDSLGQHLSSSTIDPCTALVIFKEIASALACLHGRGFAHGAVSMDSITLSADGGTPSKLLPNVACLKVESLAETQRYDVHSLGVCFLALVLAPHAVELEQLHEGLTREYEQRLVLVGLSKPIRQLLADCLSNLLTAQTLFERLGELVEATTDSEPARTRARSHTIAGDGRPASAQSARRRRRNMPTDADSAIGDDREFSSCGSIPLTLANFPLHRSRSASRRVSDTGSSPNGFSWQGLYPHSREGFAYRQAFDVSETASVFGVDANFGFHGHDPESRRQIAIIENDLALEKVRYKITERELADERAERLVFACQVLDTFKKVQESLKLDLSADILKGMDVSAIAPTWHKLPSLPVAVEFPCICEWQGSLVVGGHCSETSTCALVRYTLDREEWETLSGLRDDWLRVDGVFVYGDLLHVVVETDIGSPASIFRCEYGFGSGMTWSLVCTLPSAHALGAVALVGSQLIVTGGLVHDLFTSAVDVYDFSTGQWLCWANMQAKRCLHTILLLNDEKIAITGGSGPSGAIKDVDIIDKEKPDSWETIMRTNGTGSAVGMLGNLLVTCGGWKETRATHVSPSAQCSVRRISLDGPQMADWLVLPDLGIARAHSAAHVANGNELYVIGGATSIRDDVNEWSVAVEKLIIPGISH